LEQLKLELEGIQVALKALKSKGRLAPLIKSLQWPLKRDEVFKAVEAIEGHKSTLNANLGCEILCVQSSISQLRILGLTVNSTLQIRDLNILTSIQDDIKHAQSHCPAAVGELDACCNR